MKITTILLVFIIALRLSVSKQIDDIYDTKRGFSSFYGDHDFAPTKVFGKKAFIGRFKGIIPYLFLLTYLSIEIILNLSNMY